MKLDRQLRHKETRLLSNGSIDDINSSSPRGEGKQPKIDYS